MFVVPALAVTCVFLLWPLARAVYLSLTDWDLLSDPRWVGLDNYRELATSDAFRNSLWVTGYYVGLTTLVTIPLAFALALGLQALGGRLKRALSAIYFLPVVLSTVIASVLFVSVWNPYGGVLRLLPLPFGLDVTNWYQDSGLVVPALVAFTVWKGIGLYVVIFVAALENLPSEPIEAARVDGARAWQIVRDVTIPLLRPVFLFASVVAVIFGFQNFAIVYTSTKGGPGDSSEILPILVYERAFRDFEMGEASAIAMVMFLIVATLTLVQFRLFRERHVG
jgi:multiple sugar transport system permease protein